MNCREFDNLASAVLEGESHPEACQHLAACPRCRLLVNDLSALEGAARTLPLYEPSRRLWARLEAAATQEGLWGQPGWQQWSAPFWNLFPLRPAAVGALAVLLLLAGGLINSPTLNQAGTPPTAFEVAQGELVQGAGYTTRYQMHLNQVENRVLADTAAMDEELRQLVAGPLGDVDRAIEQTQLRLDTYPDDTLAREELQRLYQQKATVLQAMSNPVWMAVGR